MAGKDDCGCGKPKPGPLGGKPREALVASAGASGNVTYVAPDGRKTSGLDLLGAKAAVARHGGRIEFS